MDIGELFSNPIVTFIIIGLLGWVFNRGKDSEENTDSKPVRPNKPQEAPAPVRRETVQQSSSGNTGMRDDDIRRAIQQREQELKKKMSPTAQKQAETLAKSIEEQYKKQKAKLDTLSPKTEEIKQVMVQQAETLKQPKKVSHPKPASSSNTAQKKQVLFDFKNTDIREVFVMTEIFGPPRSKRKQIR